MKNIRKAFWASRKTTNINFKSPFPVSPRGNDKRKLEFFNMPFCQFIVLFTVCLFACNKETESGSALSPFLTLSKTQLKAMDIDLAPLKIQAIQPVIYATGKVRLLPNSEAIISGNISGKVEKILVVEGENVRKNQHLFIISSMEVIELQQNYLVAKNQIDFLKLEFTRQSELRKNNIGSLSDYQKFESEYRIAANTVESLSEKLKLLGIDLSELNKEKPNVVSTFAISSPLDGSVFKLSVVLGQRIEASSDLASIINLSKLQADVDVFENDIDEVYEGQTVEINFMSKNMPTVQGKVFHILKSIDPESRSIPVFVDFYPPKQGFVLPEMAVKVKIIGTSDNQLKQTVPQSAIIQEGELFYIYYAVNKSDSVFEFHKVKVTTGEADHERVQITPFQKLPEKIMIVQKNAHLIDGEIKKKGMVG